MASWFTRALDKVTPWNRGGEVQRRQERKKREEEEEFVTNQLPKSQNRNVPANQPVVGNQMVPSLQLPKPQQPTNVFEDLNKDLVLNKPKTILSVTNNPDNQPIQTPKPGMVVRPTTTRGITLPDGRNTKDIPDTPETIIERGLDAGKSWEDIAKENNYRLDGVKEYSQRYRPDYGIKLERPKQSWINKQRDFYDANTESDKWRRQEGNKTREPGTPEKPITLVNPGNIVGKTPIVGHVAKGLNTLGAQIAELPATIEGAAYTKVQSDLMKEQQDALKRGDKFYAQDIQRKLDLLQPLIDKANREQDAAHTNFIKNKGGLFNTGTLYDEEGSREGDAKTAVTDIALPTAVTMADVYTLGQGTIISEGLKGGVRVGLPKVAPNIVKATVGNYASGDLGARSMGATNEEAMKAGFINSALGIVPDVGLPLLGSGIKNKVVPSIVKGRGVPGKVVAEELDDAALSASAEGLVEATKPRPITVGQSIPINEVASEPMGIGVRNMTEPKPLIKEFPGDASIATPDPLVRKLAEDAREEAAAVINNAGRPDPRIEGVAPGQPSKPFTLDENVTLGLQDKLIGDYADLLRNLGERNGVDMIPDGQGGYKRVSNNFRPGDTKGKRMTKAMWREEAERQLRSGGADPTIQSAFDDIADPEVQSLLAKGEQPDVPIGRPISVKQVNGINVMDDTKVPQNLPETPGTVRVTSSTAPSNAKSELIAKNPTPILPPETQAILDNPKQFNKRQVASARNQRKLARAMAKTQEQTAEAMDRIQTASPASTSGESFAPTGEFAKSQNGGTYQKASRATEMAQAIQETSQMSPADVLQTARKNQGDTGGFNRRDIRNISALFESKRIARGTPEWNEARQILKEDGTVWGQQGALRNYTMRRTATANELISRYESKIYRLADDPTKIEGKWFDEVEKAEEAYTVARDDATSAYNEFTRDPTSANAQKYHAAQDLADKADKAAKETEYSIAKRALKGNKDVKQIRELEKMADNADLYQMDAVDASMLSGTGTFIRNFVNSAVGGVEESLFGGLGSRVSRLITRQKVGGGIGKGTLSGFGEGVENLRDVAGARAKNAGWNPLEHLKNWSTTGNQLGDTVIDSQVKHNVVDHYTQILKDQGYKGRELADRASVMARQDPDGLARTYAGAARVSAGLGDGITRNNKIETLVKNLVSDGISLGKPTPLTEATGKLVARMTIGFPTAIGRSTAEGVKRFTLGAPTFIKAVRETDPLKRAVLIKEGIKQAGTGGAVVPPLFYALGANDMISGAYPSDKNERAQWEREGKTENSIKIGGAWYQLPAYLGSWAVPALFYASLGRNGGDWSAAATDTAKAIPALLPTDQASNILDVVNGRTDLGKFMAQTGASTVRAVTPAGALLNQIAKSFDPTKNDTNSGTDLENFVDKVLSGIPGVNNMSDIPDKLDDGGNVIENPKPLEVLAGAASAVQTDGEERTRQINTDINSTLSELDKYGLLNDPNMEGVLEGTGLEALNKSKSGKQLDESDIKALKEAYVKGVSTEGTDTAYLERGQYDTNLAVLKLKRDLMDDDKTVKPSSLKDVDNAIKRGEIYKENQIPYDLISEYQSVGVEEWRKMGDPEDADYNPEMYQKLFDIDRKLTDAGVSYKKGSLDKPKYFVKGDGTGSGGGKGSRQIDTSFGTLKDGSFAPKIQQYSSIDQKSGSVPIIRRVRPNIVHKITASR